MATPSEQQLAAMWAAYFALRAFPDPRGPRMAAEVRRVIHQAKGESTSPRRPTGTTAGEASRRHLRALDGGAS